MGLSGHGTVAPLEQEHWVPLRGGVSQPILGGVDNAYEGAAETQDAVPFRTDQPIGPTGSFVTEAH